MTTDTKMVSRRQALRRGAVAGTVVWAAPLITSSVAHASGGSSGSKIDGKLDSVTCVWDRRYFQPNRGTPTEPRHDYSNDSFCEINVGRGWQTLARGDQFTIPAGNVLQMRPWSGHSGGSAVEPSTDTETTLPPTTTAEPVAEEPVVEEPVVEEPVVDTTTPTTAPPASETTVAPIEEPATTTAPVPADAAIPPALPASSYVDTIVIDMTGRTEINIGDVYGYFRIVDADPA